MRAATSSPGTTATCYFLWWASLVVTYLPFSEKWEYFGYARDWSWTRATLAALAITAASLFASNSKSIGSFCYHLALAGVIAPACVLYAWGATGDHAFKNTAVACVALRLGLAAFAPLTRSRVTFPRGIATVDAAVLLLICCGTVVGASLIALGPSNFNLDLTKTYEFRSDLSQTPSAVFSYAWPACGRVMLPVALVIALSTGRWRLALVASMLSVLLVGISSHKAMILPIMSGAFYLLMSYSRVSAIGCAVAGLCLCAISYIGFLAESGGYMDLLASVVYRRTFLDPAFLNSAYIDVFSGIAAPQYWTQSRVGQVLGFPTAELQAPMIVGDLLSPGVGSWANTGWIGSGFAQAHELGVALYSLAIALYSRILDLFVSRHGFALVSAVGLIPISMMLSASDFMTSLLTGGGVLLLAILWSVRGNAQRAPSTARGIG